MGEIKRHNGEFTEQSLESGTEAIPNKGIPRLGSKYLVAFEKGNSLKKAKSLVKFTEPKGTFNAVAESWRPERGVMYEVILVGGGRPAIKDYHGYWFCDPV